MEGGAIGNNFWVQHNWKIVIESSILVEYFFLSTINNNTNTRVRLRIVQHSESYHKWSHQLNEINCNTFLLHWIKRSNIQAVSKNSENQIIYPSNHKPTVSMPSLLRWLQSHIVMVPTFFRKNNGHTRSVSFQAPIDFDGSNEINMSRTISATFKVVASKPSAFHLLRSIQYSMQFKITFTFYFLMFWNIISDENANIRSRKIDAFPSTTA